MFMHVVGVGALNVDRMYVVERFAAPGEEVRVLRSEQSAGGSAANTIAGLARLGVSTAFVGAVGRDAEGDFLVDELRREGVDTGCVARVDAPTGVVVALVDSKGERCLYVHPGANDEVSLSDSCRAYVMDAEIVHMSSFVGERGFELQRELCDALAGRVSFAPGMLYARDRCLVELRDFIAASRVVFVNESELFHLTGNRGRRGAEMLVELGAGMVAVTRGADGCTVVWEDDGVREVSVPAVSTEVVDTTGAGDAFAAGFLYGLLRELSPEACAALGNFVASRCISRLGARNGLPDEDEALEFLESQGFL